MPHPDRDAFLDERRTGLGGSDIGTVCGLNPWSSPLEVWMAKRGVLPDAPDREPLRWGRLLEDDITDLLRFRHPEWTIRRHNRTLRHPDAAWAMGHPDRMITLPGGERVLAEFKTANARQFDAWQDGVPVAYQAQVQWYLGLLPPRVHRAVVVVVLGGFTPTEHWIDRDPETFALLFERGRVFWEQFVVPGIPPALTGTGRELAALQQWLPSHPDPVALPAEVDTLIAKWTAVKASIKTGDTEEAKLKAALVQALDGHPTGETPAHWQVRYTPSVTRRIDTETLRSTYPDIAEAVTRTSETYTLRVTPPKPSKDGVTHG